MKKTHVIEADGTPCITTRGLPVLVKSIWQRVKDIFRRRPRLSISQRLSQRDETLIRWIPIFVSLSNINSISRPLTDESHQRTTYHEVTHIPQPRPMPPPIERPRQRVFPIPTSKVSQPLPHKPRPCPMAARHRRAHKRKELLRRRPLPVPILRASPPRARIPRCRSRRSRLATTLQCSSCSSRPDHIAILRGRRE